MKDETPSSPFTEFEPPCFEKYTQQLLGWQRVILKLLAGQLGIWARDPLDKAFREKAAKQSK